MSVFVLGPSSAPNQAHRRACLQTVVDMYHLTDLVRQEERHAHPQYMPG
jgi:hypothetical protein